MATQTVEVGHIIVGENGRVLRADAGFCSIMRAHAVDLIGLTLLDITAPEDRQVCADYMRTLRATGGPFRVAKRMLRLDGSTVWVDKTVAIADFGDDTPAVPPLIVATIARIEDADRLEDPARLLGMALFLRESRRAQTLLFGPGFFTDVAWDVLLAAYIAEARGELLTLAALAKEAQISSPVVRRWLRALDDEGLIEAEDGGACYRMTATANARFEAYLANRIVKSPPPGNEC